jgi:hypothetical protein
VSLNEIIRKVVEALRGWWKSLMAHIRQTTKLRAGSATTQERTTGGGGVMGAGSATMSGSATVTPAANNPPVWLGPWAPGQTPEPIVVFQQGTAATFSVAGLVTDDDPLTITKNSVAFHSGGGVTYDPDAKLISYDGSGVAGTSSGHQFFASDGASDTVVQFGLRSGSTGSAKPFCFMHGFKRGDIPLGRDIVANIPDFQATIVNRYGDGSAKLAMLAGHIDLTANVTSYIDLKPGTANLGAPVTEASLIAAGVGADTFAVTSYGSVLLSDVIGRLSSGKGSPGLIRTRIAGPEMSEFHYYSPFGVDSHLSLFLYIRAFKNGAVEIEHSTENGWLKVPAPSARTYTPTYTVNGTNRTASVGALNHYALTGWGDVYWRGADPDVSPVHDVAYLTEAGFLPNYEYRQPAAAALTGWLSTNVPFQLGNLEPDMGATGDVPSLGMLPKWEALHCTSASVNTYKATIYNGYSMRRYQLLYRDETTMAPPRFTDHPILVYFASGWSSADRTPQATGGSNGTFDIAHHPSWCYLPFLLTGRWPYLETLQFSVCNAGFTQNPATRQNEKMILVTHTSALQTRGAAWAMRGLAQALCVTPDGDPMQAELAAVFGHNMAYYATNYVGSANQLGMPLQANNYSAGQGFTTWAPWQDDFFTMALGWAQYLQLPITATAKENLDAVVQWKSLSPAGRAGTAGTGQYCYRSANQYNLRVADSESFANLAAYNAAVYADWGTLFVSNFGPNTDCQLSANILGDMNVAAYVMNMYPALSVAVDNGNAAALAGRNRIKAAPNFIALTTAGTGFHNDPRYAVAPRMV